MTGDRTIVPGQGHSSLEGWWYFLGFSTQVLKHLKGGLMILGVQMIRHRYSLFKANLLYLGGFWKICKHLGGHNILHS